MQGVMENLPRDVTYTSGSQGQLSFGLDENVATPDTNTYTMTNYDSNSESLLSSSVLNRSGYASVLSYNLPASTGALMEFKSKGSYAETSARMYPPRWHPGISSLAFPHGTLPQNVMSVGWPPSTVAFPPSTVIATNTIPCTSEDTPMQQLDMSTHMINPLTGNFAISLPPRAFESRETVVPTPWLPPLPSFPPKSTQCSNSSTLNQDSVLAADEKSTSPSGQVISAINVSEFLNLPSQFESSFANGIPSNLESVHIPSAELCSAPPIYSNVVAMTSTHSQPTTVAYVSGGSPHLMQLSASHTHGNAENQDRICDTVTTTAVTGTTSTQDFSGMGSSAECDYRKHETCAKSPRVSVTKSKTESRCRNAVENERQQSRKYGYKVSNELWYDCKSKDTGGDESCRLTDMPERESSETSGVSGDTEIVDNAENGKQDSVSIDECNHTDPLTGDGEKRRYDSERVANMNVEDSLSQDTGKLRNEQTFSTSNQLDNNPALCSSNGPAQMKNHENNINDGLWSQEMADLDLHGNNINSTDAVTDDAQSASGCDANTSPSLCQSVNDTTMSLFNISLLSPLAQSAEVNVHIEESQCILVDGQRRWKCLICPKIYSSKHNLVTHILGHNGIKPHCCPICGKLFKQTSHLQTHALTHSHVKPHTCNVCGRAFSQASHVKRHMAVHMERRPHVCQLCYRGFVYPSELKAHHEKHKNGKANACEECGDAFESLRRLKQHKATVHKDVSDVTCSICGKVFTYPSQLRDHMLKHGGKRPYICTECGMDFMKEHHLRAHQFTHTGLRPFICSICRRSFNQKANLQRHQLIHQNLRRYRCNICGRDFSQPQVLKAHLVTHSSKKPHECKICGKQFSRLHNLNGHVHMHKGTKPYVCFCGASFTLKGNLNRHSKEKHGQGGRTTGAALFCTEENESAPEVLDEDFPMTSPVHVTRTSNDDSLESTADCTSAPKKKHRKSMPRKKIISQNGDVEDEEIEAAWRDENASDEQPADPSRLLTGTTVDVPTTKRSTGGLKAVRYTQLLSEVKQKKNVSQTVNTDCVVKPCRIEIRNNIQDACADIRHVVTLVGRKQKQFVVTTSKTEFNDSATATKTKKAETVTVKRVSSRRRSCKQVSYAEDDLTCSDDYDALDPNTTDLKWASSSTSSTKHGLGKKKTTNTSNLDSCHESKSSLKSCSNATGALSGRKENVCNLVGMKQSVEVTGINGRDCSVDKISRHGSVKVSVGIQKKRGPRIGKKASLLALMAAKQQPEET